MKVEFSQGVTKTVEGIVTLPNRQFSMQTRPTETADGSFPNGDSFPICNAYLQNVKEKFVFMASPPPLPEFSE